MASSGASVEGTDKGTHLFVAVTDDGTWDYENQTTLVEPTSGVRVTMAYNADNRRVWKDT